jgi:hypothetical protein
MKLYLLSPFLLLIIVSKGFGQTPFSRGYYVLNGDTLRGYVEERESYFKSALKFKQEVDSEPKSYEVGKISSIYLSDFDQLYIKQNVSIDKKPIDVSQLEENISKKIVNETVFLRFLVIGKVDLLRYKDEDNKVHFFYQKLGEVKELNFVRYRDKNSRLIEFEEYKQQLKNLFVDCELNVKSILFSEKSLAKSFTDYNRCMGFEIKSEQKRSGTKLFINAILGLSSNVLSYSGRDNSGTIVGRTDNYNSTLNPVIGLGLNFKRKKSKPIDFAVELLWRKAGTYSSSLDPIAFGVNSVNISATFLHGNFTFKYSFLRNSLFKPYVKFGAGASYLMNSMTTFNYKIFPITNQTVDPLISLSSFGYNLIGGVGCTIKRIYGEIRLDRLSHGTSNGIPGILTVNSLSFTIGYKLNK